MFLASEIEIASARQQRLFLTLLLSIGVHFLLLFALPSILGRPQTVPPPAPPIEISEVPKEWLKQVPSKSHEMHIAESEKADNQKQDPNAAFLGEHNQTVEKQTRAKIVDDFRKKMGSGAKAGANDAIPKNGDNTTGAEDKLTVGVNPESDTKKGGVKRNWKTLSLKDLGIGGDGAPTAATDDRLEGVAVGDRTVLSTREFRYYSYYNRIKELLRLHWKPNVERKLAMLWAKGKQFGDEELVTKVLVLLDGKGNINRVQKLVGSGFNDLDEAAIEAFQKAAPFPNPPHGIVDTDGFVRVRWDFILQTSAGPRIQFQPVR